MFAICFNVVLLTPSLHRKCRIEVTNNKIYQDFIAEVLILFQNMGFNNMSRAQIC